MSNIVSTLVCNTHFLFQKLVCIEMLLDGFFKFLTDGHSQTNFFTVLSLATGGMVLNYTGLLLRSQRPSANFPLYMFIETTFAGCLIVELFLVSHA